MKTENLDVFETSPWKCADGASWKIRESHIWDSRVASLNKLVQDLRRETRSHVPWIDPFCGGGEAQILVVLLRPGPLGAMATNFLSLANNDATARNTADVLAQARVSYRKLVFWNAIPWSGERKEEITSDMLARGSSMLERLLPLLSHLRCVILAGGEAKRVRNLVTWPRAVHVIECAHPGPFVWNQHRYRARKQEILEAFRAAAALLSS